MRDSRHSRYTLFGAGAVCALLVVPVALAGGEQTASSSAGATKLVKKLQRQVAGLNVRLAALEGRAPAAGGGAGGDLAGSFPNPSIAPDAVGAPEIEDPTRSVNLPLGSFVNHTDQDPLSYDGTTEITGLNPDLVNGTGGALEIFFDDDAGGADAGDTDFVASTLAVPSDYAADGRFAITARKSSNTTTITERVTCIATRNGAELPAAATALTATAATTYEVPSGPAYDLAPGDTLGVRCGVDDGSLSGPTFDDPVSVRAVEFRYSAAQ